MTNNLVNCKKRLKILNDGVTTGDLVASTGSGNLWPLCEVSLEGGVLPGEVARMDGQQLPEDLVTINCENPLFAEIYFAISLYRPLEISFVKEFI